VLSLAIISQQHGNGFRTISPLCKSQLIVKLLVLELLTSSHDLHANFFIHAHTLNALSVARYHLTVAASFAAAHFCFIMCDAMMMCEFPSSSSSLSHDYS
jgi:hypothetical protein